MQMWRAMRESRQFMRSVDPLSYRVAWVGTIFDGVYSLGLFTLLGVFFQNVSAGQLQEWLDPAHLSWQVIAAGVGIIMLFQFARGFSWALRDYQNQELRAKVDFTLERQTVALLSSLDAGRLADPEFIKLKELMSRRYEYAAPELFRTQTQLLAALVGVVTSIGVMAVLDPLFILLAAVPVTVELVKEVRLDRKRRDMWDANHLLERRKEEYQTSLTTLQRLVQGKLFRFEGYWRQRFTEYVNELWGSERAVRQWSFKWEVGIQVLSVLMFGMLALYLGNKLMHGDLSFSELFFFWGSVQTLGRSLGNLSSAGVEVRKECLDYSYREQFLAAKPLIDESGAELFRFSTTPRLEMRDVSFRYPRQETLALRGCSLSIAPGEKVALVGENGSGKTTILRLLSKIYLPDEGAVMIDDLPTLRIKQSSWFEQMLYSTQDYLMPELVLEEAVAGTRPGTANVERLVAAAEHSRAASVVGGLPEQYQTQIGADWPGGWEPSAGQWQRLKLTAAFYRLLEPQVRVGLFDEPMSQCDIETRELFYKGLRSVHHKTIVVVAHDPVYLHYFTRVILIENGRVGRDMRTREEIAAYQREATPRFEEIEHAVALKVVE